MKTLIQVGVLVVTMVKVPVERAVVVEEETTGDREDRIGEVDLDLCLFTRENLSLKIN